MSNLENEFSRKGIVREVKLLSEVHRKIKDHYGEENQIEGIQNPHDGLIKYDIRDGVLTESPFLGYLTRYYEKGNMDNIPPETDSLKALRLCRILFCALDKIHKINFVHGDIKPENILFDEDGVFIADWGGVKRMSKKIEVLKEFHLGTRHVKRTAHLIGAFTTKFVHPEDIRVLEDMMSPSDVSEEQIIKFELLERERDVYSMSFSLTEYFHKIHDGVRMIRLEDEDYFRKMREELLFSEMQLALLERALSPRYQDRPSAEEMYQAFS